MLFPLLLLWGAIGATIGFFVSKIVNLRGDAPIGGIGVSALSGAIAGLAWNLFSGHGFTEWTRWSCLWALIGAAVGVTVWHLIRSRYVSHAQASFRRSY
jgi:uncharacterized membrane protein YeaQ/YmgE (transglycosylase-associated protein family)